MANPTHLKTLHEGVDAWNAWRSEHSDVNPDLSGAALSKFSFVVEAGDPTQMLQDEYMYGSPRGWEPPDPITCANLTGVNLRGSQLSKADMQGVDLSGADLSGASLQGTNLATANLSGAIVTEAALFEADLSWAELSSANFSLSNLRGTSLNHVTALSTIFCGADLSNADASNARFERADLSKACLEWASLSRANFCEAKLIDTNLRYANVVEADFSRADLTGCGVYGISAWGLKLSDDTKQHDLVITPADEAQVTVDDIEVAQFVYLLLRNEKIRDVIDTVGKKGVLLLGRFTGGRLAVLDRLRDELRKRGFVPMVFSFDKPESKDFTETIRLLAALSHFVIVDITNPRSAPLELQATVPECMVPFVPILEKGEEPFAMLADLWIKHGEWVLNPIRYQSLDRLIAVLDAKIIGPARARFAKLQARKAEQMRVEDV